MASLILGTTGLFFGAITTPLGAYLVASHDSGRVSGGYLVVIASIVPHVVSIVAVSCAHAPGLDTHEPAPHLGGVAVRRSPDGPYVSVIVGSAYDQIAHPDHMNACADEVGAARSDAEFIPGQPPLGH